MIKNLANKLHITPPVIFMMILFFAANTSAAFFAVFGRELSSAFDWLYFIALVWVMGWWLKTDNLVHKQQWVYEIGILVYVAWVVVMPIYLFKTRGVLAFFSFFKFAVIYLGSFAAGVIFSFFVKLLVSI